MIKQFYFKQFTFYRLIGLRGRVFANGPGDQGSISRSRHTKDF